MSKEEIREILSKAEKKIPKKVREKLKWKKVGPIIIMILTEIIGLLSQFLQDKRKDRYPGEARSGQTRAGPTAPPASLEHSPLAKKAISDSMMRGYVEQALAYQAEIDRKVQAASGAVEHERLQSLALRVRAWAQAIQALAERVDAFQQNEVIQRDLKAVPKAVTRLEERLAKETDSHLRPDLEQTLAHRRKQQAALEQVQASMHRAEIKIESTVSLLGTIYSQILAGQSRNHVADYRRLLDDVNEEVHTLQDHLEALEEVKFGAAGAGKRLTPHHYRATF